MLLHTQQFKSRQSFCTEILNVFIIEYEDLQDHHYHLHSCIIKDEGDRKMSGIKENELLNSLEIWSVSDYIGTLALINALQTQIIDLTFSYGLALPASIHSPLLGLQNFSMPCLIKTMRDSSVKDSMTLKLHRGLTSKKVIPFFSAYALACSVGTCRLKAKCSRLPTRIRGTPGACWKEKKKQKYKWITNRW